MTISWSRPVPDQDTAGSVRAIVELPPPIRTAGYAERTPYKLNWEGGATPRRRILVIRGRTLTPEDAWRTPRRTGRRRKMQARSG